MDIEQADMEMCDAHRSVGGFIARCSLLDYRVSQFVARWFCSHEKQKFLSYTLKAMPFAEKRQIIEERLTRWHRDPEALRAAMREIAAVLERRNLVASGVLSRRTSGALCIKSFSGARFISEPGAIDIINIDDLVAWSEKASELAERMVALGLGLLATSHEMIEQRFVPGI
jgi:hypothetical protein